MALDGKKEPLGLRVFRGVEIHLLGQIAIFSATFLITPRLVRGLGTDGYALYTLIWTLLSYMTLFAIGTNAATQRFTALFLGRKEPERLSRLLLPSLLFQVLAAATASGLVLLFHEWAAMELLHIEPRLQETAATVFSYAALAAPFYFLLRFATDVLYGRQKFAECNLFNAAQTILVSVAAVIIVSAGGGLDDVAAAFLAVMALLSAAALWEIRRDVFLVFRSPDVPDVREYASFSIKSFAAMIFWTLTFQGDRFIIGALLPLAQMGFYVIGSGIAQKLNVLCGAVSATMFPIFAELYGAGEEEKLRRIYLKSTQLTLFLIAPIAILTIMLAPQFLTLWLGEEFSRTGTWPLRFLVLANLAYAGAFLPDNIASGKGFPHWKSVMQAAKAALLLLLWALLIPRLGILGAAAGLMLSEWAAIPLFLWRIHRRLLDIGWREFLEKGCLRPFLAGLALLFVCLPAHGLIGSWASLIGFVSASGVVYLLAGYALLDFDAKELLHDWLRKRLGR